MGSFIFLKIEDRLPAKVKMNKISPIWVSTICKSQQYVVSPFRNNTICRNVPSNSIAASVLAVLLTMAFVMPSHVTIGMTKIVLVL